MKTYVMAQESGEPLMVVAKEDFDSLVQGCNDNGIEIVEECTDGTGPWVRNIRAERLKAAANEVLRLYMPQFNDSRAVDGCLVGLAAAVAGIDTSLSHDTNAARPMLFPTTTSVSSHE
jgi:hypothetical protein